MKARSVDNDALKKLATFYQKLQRILGQLYLAMFSRRNCLLLLIFVFVYGVTFSYLTLVKYYTFGATGWDLGVFSQSLYTTLNKGAFFQNNLEMGSHFHVHFSPILVLLLPFYAIYQNAATLLVLQAFVIALGAIPLYCLAKQEFGNAKIGLAFAALYLLYPGIHGANLYDFHPEVFTPLFIFSALYFFKNGKWKSYFAFVLLVLSIKEDIPLIVIAIGLYGLAANARALFQRRMNKFIIVSSITICVGVAWLFLGFYAISYFVRLDGYESLWNAGFSHHTENAYGTLGSGGPLGVIISLLSNPLRIVSQLQYLPAEKLVFIATLFLPLCMTPFLDFPSIFLFLPTLSEFILASKHNYFLIIYHYPVQLTPVLFVAAVHGLKKLSAKYNHPPKHAFINPLLSLMLISTLITTFFTMPILMQDTPLVIGEEHRIRLALISLIPMDSDPRILTQNDYFPLVSNSRYAFAYWNTTNVDYILIDTNSHWFNYQDPPPDEYVARYGEPQESFIDRVVGYVNSGEFGLLGQAETLLLYKRGFSGALAYYVPYNPSFDLQNLAIHGEVVEDPTAISSNVLLSRAVDQKEGFFWYGPYATMPPGKYEVKFRLKIANATDKYILTLDVAADFGGEVLISRDLFGEDFSNTDTWQCFTLQFQLDKLTRYVEFRGINISNATDVYLDCISLTQISPYSPSP